MSIIRKNLVYFDQWVAPVALDILGAQPDINLSRLDYADPVEETWKVMSQAHGYQISPRGELQEPWFGDAELIQRCPDLLAITSTGSGYDMVDVDACTAAGIIVCSQTGANRISVAEHTLGMMLGLVKRITSADRVIRKTANVNRFSFTGSDLNGKVVGIVGIGQIGTRVSEMCAAFGCSVIAYDPFLSEAVIQDRGARKVSFEELLEQADIVTVHAPRTEQTFNMFSRPQFAAMKPTACFLNCARGGIHDEEALAQALERGEIAGAGVDVFLQEPPAPSHPLLQLDTVIATPHTAGLSTQALETLARYAAEQWIEIFKGAVPPRLINPEAWPKYQQRFSKVMGWEPAELPGVSSGALNNA